MQAIKNEARQLFSLSGLSHRTLASRADSLSKVEVWMQTMDPGSETPLHYHQCEEVIVVLKGSGRISVDNESSDFGPDTTLIIKPEQIHQLINTGTEALVLMAALSETPARVFDPHGNLIDLPWS